MRHGNKGSKKRCNKVAYKTPAEARAALNLVKKTISVKRFYRCPHCVDKWHLTSE